MKLVNNRRTLRFDNLDEALAESERLAALTVTTEGRFGFGQILEHLARTVDVVNGSLKVPKVAWPLRVVAKALKSRILAGPMPSGVRLPSKTQSILWPSHAIDVAAGLRHYRDSVNQLTRLATLPEHPVFGTLMKSEHIQLQCRHAELHLSFVHAVAHTDSSSLDNSS